ncbi:MAG: hypothetical protein J6A75_07055 [Lachnospiraceae bacterium]|nr:hypothetical protein [Lachnospiraceae bacterium]
MRTVGVGAEKPEKKNATETKLKKEIKELKAKNEQLKAENEELKAENEQLKAAEPKK